MLGTLSNRKLLVGFRPPREEKRLAGSRCSKQRRKKAGARASYVSISLSLDNVGLSLISAHEALKIFFIFYVQYRLSAADLRPEIIRQRVLHANQHRDRCRLCLYVDILPVNVWFLLSLPPLSDELLS